MRPSAGAAARVAAAAGGGSTVAASSSRCCSTSKASPRISPPLFLPSSRRAHPASLCPDRPTNPARRASRVLAAAPWARSGAAAAPEPSLSDASALCRRRANGPATQRSSSSRSRRKNVVRARAASPSVSDASSSSSSSPPPPSSSSSSQASGGGSSSRDVSASASASAVAAQSLGASLPTRRHSGDSSSSSSASSSPSSTPLLDQGRDLFDDGDDIDPLAPRPPLLLRWLRDAEAELRALSFSLNFLLIGVAAAAAAGGAAAHSLDAVVAAAHAAAEAAEAAAHGGMHDPVTLDAVTILSSPFKGFGGGAGGESSRSLLSGASASALAAFLGAPWRHFAALHELHPLGLSSAVSGTVYGLGDLTAQAYEGRGLRDLDAARLLRSAAAGAVAHGPLSAVFYERLDRFVILSDALGNGDAWFAPLFKVGIDQTLWAATWNALYLSLLGLMRLESPGAIRRAVAGSGWDVLRAGWRLWPLVHLLTYTVVPLEARLLWVDAVDLGWVSVLAAYAAQRKGREEEKQRRRAGGVRG